MIQLEKMKLNLLEGFKLCGVSISENQIEIIDWGCPHKTKNFTRWKNGSILIFLR